MDYRFGPGKPEFTGTDEEWKNLAKRIARTVESNDPNITVICPHCGARNVHCVAGYPYEISHRVCDSLYSCPGYCVVGERAFANDSLSILPVKSIIFKY